MSTAIADPYFTRDSQSCYTVDRVDPVVWGDGGDGPFDRDALREYDDTGFHTTPGLISADDVQACFDELHELAGERSLRDDPRVIREQDGDIRSIFDIHLLSDLVASIVRRPEVVGAAEQVLGSDVYVHQSRLNFKPGFHGGPFYWHSDFETWHAEDGMPTPRAASMSIALTPNFTHNGALMIMPGTHKVFVGTAGETPEDYFQESLTTHAPPVGSPDHKTLTALADEHGIATITGDAGAGTLFDSNCMHGSNGNITPDPRSNLFVVFNSVENTLDEPYAAPSRRPEYLGSRTIAPVR